MHALHVRVLEKVTLELRVTTSGMWKVHPPSGRVPDFGQGWFCDGGSKIERRRIIAAIAKL